MATIDPDTAHVLRLLGEGVAVLNPQRTHHESGEGGGDIDCAVSHLNLSWPLRLTGGWRLCQCLHYDGTAWYWILERGGEVLRLDTLEDPLGVGRYGFPTTLAWDGPDLEASPPARAAYLTVKRLRKGMESPDHWERIAELARASPQDYLSNMKRIFDRRSAERLSTTVLDGAVPDDALRIRSLAGQRLRRMTRGLDGVRLLSLSTRRVVERLTHPTGLVVLVVGPDGAGKSTLVDALLDSCHRLFRRTGRLHWRPGVLPTPASMMGHSELDVDLPHSKPVHGHLLSLALLAYHWADFAIGGTVRILPLRARSGLVIWERGWWDVAVDPTRYRLQVPSWLVRALGLTLPKPDLALVLEAPAEVILERKSELTAKELERQRDAWKGVLPRGVPRVFLDAQKPPGHVAEEGRESIVRVLEKRAMARLGPGWATLPGARSSRWWIPRGPRAASLSVLSKNLPIAGSERRIWRTALRVAQLGASRLLPRATGPPSVVREALAPYIRPGDSIAVSESNHEDRYLAQVVSKDGVCRIVSKMATDQLGQRALSNEVQAIAAFGSRLSPPLSAPRVLASRPEGVVIFEGISWRPRPRPWLLRPGIAFALGKLFAATREDQEEVVGFSHGDFTPWNLLEGHNRWVLINWEAARTGVVAFFDLFHYLIEAHLVLCQPSVTALRQGLAGVGWVGSALEAYAEGAGVPRSDVDRFFALYLSEAAIMRSPSHVFTSELVRARRRLLTELLR
jgi:hypothetical protein